MLQLIRKHFIFFDSLASIIFVVVLALLNHFVFPSFQILVVTPDKDYGDLYLTLSTIYAGLLGFIITAGAIIFSIDSGKRIDVLRKSPFFSQIFNSYLNASFWLLATTVLVLAIYVHTDTSKPSAMILLLIVGTVILNIVKGCRAVSLLKKVYKLSDKINGD